MPSGEILLILLILILSPLRARTGTRYPSLTDRYFGRDDTGATASGSALSVAVSVASGFEAWRERRLGSVPLALLTG